MEVIILILLILNALLLIGLTVVAFKAFMLYRTYTKGINSTKESFKKGSEFLKKTLNK